MSLFKDMLASDESLFRNEEALNYDYVPKLLPHREMQQRQVAACIKPLFADRAGKNVFCSGAPGIGKTAAIRWVLRDLEENSDEIKPFYVNCWQKNTTYKVMLELCDQLDFKFVQSKKTEELFKVVKDLLINKGAVFVFDEVDKLEDFDFLYTVLEEIMLKSVILITNYKEWLMELDERIKSRLICEDVHFNQYNDIETHDIIKKRADAAFVPGVWEKEALDVVGNKTFEKKDIRTGIYLLREAGMIAEEASSKKITMQHANHAVGKLDDFTVKSKEDLEEDTRKILDVVKQNNGEKIGELYKTFQQKGGLCGYKSFARKIEKLEKWGFVVIKKTSGGPEGNTSIISAKEEKKITDY